MYNINHYNNVENAMKKILLLTIFSISIFGSAQSTEDALAALLSGGDSSGLSGNLTMGENEKVEIKSYTQSEYSNIVNQIEKIDEAAEIEKIRDVLYQQKIDLAVRLCAQDQNACFLVEEYQNYKDSKPLSASDKLEIFGINLFSGYPLSFNQSDQAGVPESYSVRAGDSFAIQLISTVTNSANTIVVNREGKVLIPKIGSVQVAGLSYKDAKDAIISFVAKKNLGAEVDVSINSINVMQIYALGLVKNPGAFRIGSASKSVNAVIASGGFNSNASLRDISIKRDGKLITSIDLYDFLINGNTSADSYLRDGDTVLISGRKNSVSIRGEVNRPAIYEFKAGETLQDLLNFSLGVTEVADENNISLKRKNEYGQYVTYSHKLTDSFTLKAGDKVEIGSSSGENLKNIKLLGSIRKAGNFPFQDNLVLGRLISIETDLLDRTYTPFVLVKRYNRSTRSYTFLDTDLISQARLNKFKLKEGDEVYFFSHSDMQSLNSKLAMNQLQPPISLLAEKAGMPALSVDNCFKSLLFFSNQDFIESTKLKLSIGSLQDNLDCSPFLNKHPNIIPVLYNRAVPVFGAVVNPGLYPVSSQVDSKTLLDVAGGLPITSGNELKYEVGSYDNSNFSISTNLTIQKNLKFLNVQSTSLSTQESYVTLVGEFKYPGMYQIDKNTSVLDLINRAGGLTDKAFPLGAILSRDSIKKTEEVALKKAEQELADILASAVTSGIIEQSSEDIVGLMALMQQIGTAGPVGRLVTELDPMMLTRDRALDIFLEAGDTLYMPPPRNTITITGNVLNPVTVPFFPANDLKDYIKLAGGYKDSAEVSKAYVLQPNGLSFIPAETGIFTFNKTSIQPGATIVVPRKARPLSGLSLVEAVTPVLANLSITMASINSIRAN